MFQENQQVQRLDNKEYTFCIGGNIEYTHVFVYRKKQYHINLKLISIFSKYFEEIYKENKKDNIIYFNSNENDPDDSDFMESFIDICHQKSVQITIDNAVPLCSLSYIFGVEQLKRETELYINSNREILASKILFYNINKDNHQFEEIIANNLNYYIEHESNVLKDFSIVIINNILKIYYQNDHTKEENDQVIAFMFDILDAKKRIASILFSYPKFDKDQMKYIKKLLDDYKNTFDFNYLNETLSKYVFEQNKIINELKSNDKNKNDEMKSLNIHLIDLNNQINSLNEQNDKNLDDIKKLELLLNCKCKEIEKLEKEKNDDKDKIKSLNDVNNINIQMIIDLKKQNDSYKKEIEDLKKEKEKLIKRNEDYLKENKNLITDNKSYINMIKNLTKENQKYKKKLNIIENDDIKEKTVIYKDENLISYRLYEVSKTAEVIRSPKITKDKIPDYINFGYEEYKIIRICRKAFGHSSIESLTFSKKSFITSIESDALQNSRIKQLTLPKSLMILDDLWCQGADYLEEVKIDPENPYFSNQNGILIYTNKNVKEIMFVSRDFKGTFTIPFDITRIGSYAFQNLRYLISIESSLEDCSQNENIENNQHLKRPGLSLNSFCFINLPNLSKVDIKRKDVYFQNNCFFNCTNLNSIIISEASKIDLGSVLISGCTNLHKIMLSKLSEIVIHRYCFNESNLKLISFLDVKSINIHRHAFNNCEMIEKILIQKASEVNIDKDCICNLEKLSSIEIDTNSISADKSFLNGCNSLTNLIIQSKKSGSLTISNVFKNNKLKEVILHLPQLKLMSNCFEGLKDIEKVDIKCRIHDIGDNCFTKCQSISSFTFISEQDLKLDKKMFDDLKKLDNLRIETKSTLSISDDFLNGFSNLKKIKFVGKKVTIGNLCFKDCVNLSEFIIDESGSIQLGNNLFQNCPNLETIYIKLKKEFESSCIIFGKSCFCGAFNLKDFNLEGGNVKINNDCFKSCSSLKNFYILNANSVEIDKNQFLNSVSLENVIIQSKLTTKIGENCFSGSSKLKIVSITGNENIIIENNAFKNCSTIRQLKTSITKKLNIGKNAFENCSNIEIIDFKFTTLFIDDECFKGSNVKEISFNKLDDLINISDSAEIGSNAFKNNKKLEKVTINTKEICIHDSCFKCCQLLSEVNCPIADKIIISQNTFDDNYEKYLKYPLKTPVQIDTSKTDKKTFLERFGSIFI